MQIDTARFNDSARLTRAQINRAQDLFKFWRGCGLGRLLDANEANRLAWVERFPVTLRVWPEDAGPVSLATTAVRVARWQA